jgi:hypothetical protein
LLYKDWQCADTPEKAVKKAEELKDVKYDIKIN